MLLLFLILLGSLIISVLFGIKINGEGFIGYNKSGDTNKESKYLQGYDNNITKVFDNNYYDRKNGNIVVIDGSGDNTITGYSVISRDGSKKQFSSNSERWSETNMSTIKDTNSSWDIDINNSFSQNHLYYIPYKKETYIYVCDTSSANIGHHCYRFSQNGTVSSNGSDAQYIPVSKMIDLPSGVSQSDDKNNQMVDVSNTRFKTSILQIRPGIYYDKTTGYVITSASNTAEPTVYDRYGSITTAKYPTTFQDTTFGQKTDAANYGKSFNAFIIKRGGTNYVVVMTNIKDTIILSIGSNKLDRAWRIDSVGTDWSGVETQTTPPPSLQRDIDVTQSYPPIPTTDWWNDYMRKTEVVPPVCPACPTCPAAGGSGTCVNCGAGGGTGGTSGGVIGSAVGTTGNVANNVINTAGGLAQSAGGVAAGLAGYTLGSATGLARDATSGTVGLARDATSGTVGLARDAASGTIGLGKDIATGTYGAAKDVVSGTVGLGKDAVSGTVGLAKDTVSGTLGLGKDAVSGTAGFIKSLGSGATQLSSGGTGANPGYQGNPQYPVGPLDPYTYNGALSQKQAANFMPLTADFSKFGR